MNYILFDYPYKGQKSFITQQISCELREVYSPSYHNKILRWVFGCISVISKSSKDDTIVCWFDFQAILCFWMSKIFFCKRKIACINLMLKDKESIKNRLVGWLYAKALNSKDFVASITSTEYGEYLKKRFGIGKKLFLIHDVFHDNYKYGGATTKPNTVFCGGHNGRNWNLIIEVAKSLPTVEFHLVMSEVIYANLKTSLPKNVIVKRNIPIDEFMKELCSAELITLPLNTNAPAGLIVFFRAAANMKYIITTDTLTSKEYFSDERGCLLPNDPFVWQKVIREKMVSKNENMKASMNLLSFLQNECSEKKFVEGIEAMLKEVQC